LGGPYFQTLQYRLLDALRRCIGNGVLTERGLARWAGISQPHMHHILKGARALSPQIADCILRTLQLTVVDLLELAELGERHGWEEPGGSHERVCILVGQAHRDREQEPGAGLPVAEFRRGTGERWPLPGRYRAPGAPPQPS